MTIKEKIKSMPKHKKVFVIIFIASYFFNLVCYTPAGYVKYGWLAYQPFTFFALGTAFLVARGSILTDIRAHGYMGPFDYLFAVIKQVCLYLFIFTILISISQKEKECFGTTYIADLFVQCNDKYIGRERIKFIKSIYNEIVTAISYWLYGH